MNIEKIFNDLEEDEQNSALGIICSCLENQGYDVRINDLPVKAEQIFEEKFEELEKQLSLKLSLYKSGSYKQSFSVEFIEFHKIIIKQ